MDDTHRPFEIPIRVFPSDIDELGHFNNVVYLRWVQEAATSHWRALAPVPARARIALVGLRHEIDYKKPALGSDELVAKTWVGSSTRLSFERQTEILRSTDTQVLARARTLWCPIDVDTGRPIQVSQEVRALFSVPSDRTDPHP